MKIAVCRLDHLNTIARLNLSTLQDNGHDTGFCSWDYLHELGAEQDPRWAAYLDALTARGLSR